MLGRLVLLVWFRKTYFGYHAGIRLRFKISRSFGELWTRDDGIPQGCPFRMVFIAAFISLGVGPVSTPGVQPQLYADNLKCVSGSSAALLSAARFTNLYIRVVGH